MSMYNLLFGRNAQSDLLLAVIGLKQNDVERFRDAFVSADGSEITIRTRTGGGNREDYPNLTMRTKPGWKGSVDDDFDSTYCDDTFSVDEQWRQDVANLSDVMKHGIRGEFAQHLALTMSREPTADDLATKAREDEAAAIARLRGVKANGHTFVPYDDHAMETALRLAEANGGELRSCWGILPLALTAPTNHYREIKPREAASYAECNRVEIKYEWATDETYLAHAVTRFAAKYPKAVAAMVQSAKRHSKQAAE